MMTLSQPPPLVSIAKVLARIILIFIQVTNLGSQRLPRSMPISMPKMRVWLAGRRLWASFPERQQETPLFRRYVPPPPPLFSLSLSSFSIGQVTVLTLELASSTLPDGKRISFRLDDPAALAETKKHPIVIKEGVEYKYVYRHYDHRPGGGPTFDQLAPQCPYHLQSQPLDHLCTSSFSRLAVKGSHFSFQGVRYLQVVKRAGVKGKNLLRFLPNL